MACTNTHDCIAIGVSREALLYCIESHSQPLRCSICAITSAFDQMPTSKGRG